MTYIVFYVKNKTVGNWLCLIKIVLKEDKIGTLYKKWYIEFF